MPIRLTDDDDDDQSKGSSNNNNNNNNNDNPKHDRSRNTDSDSNAGIIGVILLVLFGLFKFPKTTIAILLVAAVAMYMTGVFDGGTSGGDSSTQNNRFGLGCKIDQKKYDKAAVYTPLDVEFTKSSLPRAATLEKFAPKRLNQGQQGSCVGWASAYAARTIVEAVATGDNPNDVAFSPAFLYNQIALEDCDGSYTSEALEKLENDGALFLSEFPYDESTCSHKPNAKELARAKDYTIRGYTRLSKSGNEYDVNLDALKQNIAQGGPVILAMKIPNSFCEITNEELWTPRKNEFKNIDNLGGHAMCAVGYDDDKFGGAVQIMNSWGSDWGARGFIWVKYSDFMQFCREAYAVFPPEGSAQVSDTKFELSLGLWQRTGANAGEFMELEQTGKYTFANTTPFEKGASFKIAVNNSMDCYLYIFGEETDGSSYILFPYEKFSPYFGVTGTRLFPRDKSLTADNKGTVDYMAIVATKEPIDFKQLNNRINNSSKQSYAARVREAVGKEAIANPDWLVDTDGIQYSGESDGKNALIMVFEITKE